MPEADDAPQAAAAPAPAPATSPTPSTPETYQIVVHADDVDHLGRDTMDPLGTGLRGATIGITERAYGDLRKKLAKRVGIFRAVVGKPPTDVWSAGWEVISQNPKLVEACRAWDASLEVHPNQRHAKNAFRRAHKLARRDQRAAVLYELRGMGDAGTRPSVLDGTPAGLRLRVVPHDRIGRIDYEDGELVRVEILARAKDSQSGTWVDADRIQFVIEEPDEDAGDELLGESILDACLLSGHALLNLRWAANEAYFGHACPLYVLTFDKDVKLSDEEKKDIRKQLKNMTSNVNRKAYFRGGTIEAIVGSTTLADPTPAAALSLDDIAAATGIGKRELTGNEAGALEAAEWDMKRYLASVVNTLRDEFATGILLNHYAKGQKWGFLPAEGKVEGIHWNPFLQLTEKEQAIHQGNVATALDKYGRIRLGGKPMRAPQELVALITPQEGDDLTLPLTVEAQDPFGLSRPPPGPAADPDEDDDQDDEPDPDARAARGDARIEVSPRVRELEADLAAAVKRALEAWRAKTISLLAERATRADGRFTRAVRRIVRGDELPPETERALIELDFDSQDLQAIIEAALLEAAQLGLMRTWRELGREGVLDFIDTPFAPTLRQHARMYASEKAAMATREVRRAIAEVLSKGGGVREIREALEATFTGLENISAIARTEAMRGYNNGSIAAMREAGVDEWQFETYSGACPTCAPQDGRVFSVTDTVALPPLHPNCRCATVPYFREAR